MISTTATYRGTRHDAGTIAIFIYFYIRLRQVIIILIYSGLFKSIVCRMELKLRMYIK